MDAKFSGVVIVSEIVDEHLDKAEELIQNQEVVETGPEELELTEPGQPVLRGLAVLKASMPKIEPLQFGQYYHIYNRGNNGEILFREQRNYLYFLKLYAKHIEPVAETFTYCLMSNHFHLLVRIKTVVEQAEVETQTGPVSETGPVFTPKNPSRQFNNLFIAYAKAINKAYQRTGALFESPFKRILVGNDRYFTNLIAYIHQNPRKHGFVEDFRDWPYCSYRAILSGKTTRVQRDKVLEWFDGRREFEVFHLVEVDEAAIEPLIVDDFA